jgi:hypothetical protein
VPWSGTIDAVAAKDIVTTSWNGSMTEVKVRARPVSVDDKTAGTVTLSESALTKEQTIPIKLKSQPKPPSVWWRLLHPIN